MQRWMMGAVSGLLLVLPVAASPNVSLFLARDLAESGADMDSALEFRRLASQVTDPSVQGTYHWMAAYQYWKAGRTDQAERMLGQAEDAAPSLETEVFLLRGENSRTCNRLREAGFYFESLTASNRPPEVRRLAARKLAAIRLQVRDYEGARKALANEPDVRHQGLAAISEYEAKKDKSPTVGGLLGLFPGLGYAYSGEYANATRSLLMNALCVWGIMSFAKDDIWGGVAVASFAEITFYTGSIYGGYDSAARYNQNRLNMATQSIEGRSTFQPVFSTLPVLSLRYEF